MLFGIIAIILCLILFHQVGTLSNQIFLLNKKLKELKDSLPSQTLVNSNSEQSSSTEQTPGATSPSHPATPVMQAAVSQPKEETSPVAPILQTPIEPPKPAEPAPVQAAPAAEPVQPVFEKTIPVQKEEKEDFSLVKILSWIGGFILFLAVGFWIKYAIENDLISPVMRIAISAMVGLILLLAGLFIKQERLKTTADTFCGVGLTVLYASIYGAYVLYQLIPDTAAFALMAGVSFVSFAVAVWKKAKYVGFLAEVISFITPVLLSRGQWSFISLFTYMAFINLAAGAAALARRWDSLLIGSVLFTFLGQVVCLSGGGFLSQVGVFCLFSAVYAASAAYAAWRYQEQLLVYTRNCMSVFSAGNLFLVMLAMLWSNVTLPQTSILLALGLFLNLIQVYLTCQDKEMYTGAWRIGKAFVFFSLWGWSDRFGAEISSFLLMGGFLAFAAINGGADFFLYKRQARQPGSGAILFPAFLMLPVLFQVSANGFLGLLITLFVLLGFSVLLAMLAGRPLASLAAGIFFLLALLVFPLNQVSSVPLLIFILCLGLVPALFVLGVARWILPDKFNQTSITVFISALMPYLLTLSLLPRMQASLSLLLGFTLLLNLFCLFLAYIYRHGGILPAAVVGSFCVQLACCFVMPELFTGDFIGWSVGIWGVFALFPILFKSHFIQSVGVWVASALSGIGAFFLLLLTLSLYYAVESSWVALLFALVYGTILYFVYSWQPLSAGIHRKRVAWLGGVTLLFITAFFPLHFNTQWVSVAWALEGAALVWMSRQLEYRAPALIGFWLLVLSTVLVFTGTSLIVEEPLPLLNRFLYVFGVVGAALLYAALRWSPKEEKFASFLKFCGGIVLFSLLNIEIAVLFMQEPGPLQFDMFGSFNSAIAYTAGWTLFGSLCLFLGFGQKGSYTARVGGILVGFSLLKLFFSDIWALGGLYRVFGLAGIACVLIGISFLFQLLQKNPK